MFRSKTAESLPDKVLDKLQKSFEMRPFPENIAKLLELIKEPEVDLKVIAKVIETDPAMAARVFRMVNSPMMGVSSSISRIDHAISMLGMSRIKSLAYVHVAAAITSSGQANHQSIQEIWKHSLACGAAARVLAEKWKFASSDEAFLAGLFHDVGQFFFLQIAPNEYQEIYSNFFGQEQLRLETEIMGLNHEEAGAKLALFWKLPESVRVAIQYHHDPTSAIAHQQLTLIVFLADCLVNAWGIGTPAHPEAEDELAAGHPSDVQLADFEPLRSTIEAEFEQMQ